jgi:hypothetical protein
LTKFPIQQSSSAFSSTSYSATFSKGKKEEDQLQRSSPWPRSPASSCRTETKMQVDAQICQKICQSRGHKAGAGRIFPKAFNLYYHTFVTTYYFYFVLEILVLKMNQVQAVPDPAPTLLDSNFVEPQNLQLLFRPSGQYAASTHLVHVRVPLTSRKFSPHQMTSFWSTENMWTNGRNRIGHN